MKSQNQKYVMSTSSKSELREKARNHLLQKGWSLFYGINDGKVKLFHTSPLGKTYYSLRTACKACIDANCLFPDEVSPTVANPPPPVAEKRKLINLDDGAASTWRENDRSKRQRRCYIENRRGELIEYDGELLQCARCNHAKFFRHDNNFHIGIGPSINSVLFSCSSSSNMVELSLRNLRAIEVKLENFYKWTLMKSSRRGPKLDAALAVIRESFALDREGFAVENSGGFYVVVFEILNKLIGAATMRIHGNKVAEVTHLVTKPIYRRLGMCHRLVGQLEKQLARLGVERLTLPVNSRWLLNIWVNSFGYKPMGVDDRLEFHTMNLLGTTICQKRLIGGTGISRL